MERPLPLRPARPNPLPRPPPRPTLLGDAISVATCPSVASNLAALTAASEPDLRPVLRGVSPGRSELNGAFEADALKACCAFWFLVTGLLGANVTVAVPSVSLGASCLSQEMPRVPLGGSGNAVCWPGAAMPESVSPSLLEQSDCCSSSDRCDRAASLAGALSTSLLASDGRSRGLGRSTGDIAPADIAPGDCGTCSAEGTLTRGGWLLPGWAALTMGGSS